MKKQQPPRGPDPSQDQIMSPREAADYLGLHTITIYRLSKKGQIPGFKVGGQWRFKKDLLDDWILTNINSQKQ